MNNARCQVNTSIKQGLKLRIEELQKEKITIETILEAGVMFYEKQVSKKKKQKSPSGLG